MEVKYDIKYGSGFTHDDSCDWNLEGTYQYICIYVYIFHIISSTRQHTLQTKHDVIVSPNKECSQGPSTRIPKRTASLLLDKIIGPLGLRP